MPRYALAFLLLAAVAASAPEARAADDEGIFDIMKQEQELNPKASIGSKKAETISESAGIVSVITQAELRNMGYETLEDLLQTVPGVTGTESFFGFFSLSFRGIKETHYNNRTLILVNGHPARDVTVGNHWLAAVPVAVIDRIEIIRGPGSVVYGNSAFAGVINIITRGATNATEVGAYAGSKNTVNAHALYGKKFDSGSAIGAVSYNNSNGYKELAHDERGINQRLGDYAREKDGYENDYYNAFANAQLGDFALDVHHMKQRRDKMGITPQNNYLYTGEADQVGTGVALRYKKELGGVEVKSSAYYGHSYYGGFLERFTAPNSPSIKMQYSGDIVGFNVDGRKTLTDQLSVLAGAAYEWQKTDPYLFTDSDTGDLSVFTAFTKEYKTYDSSLFAQLEYAPIDRLKFVAGGRYNNNRNSGNTAVPRAAAVLRAGERVYIKALYGEAYRNPSFFERYVNTKNVLYGDPGLVPEKIRTTELAADWLGDKHAVRVTGFIINTADLIARSRLWNIGDTPGVQQVEQRLPDTSPTANSVPGYANTVGQRLYGTELEFRGTAIDKVLTFNTNLSVKNGIEKNPYTLDGTANSRRVQFLDKLVAHLALTHHWEKLTNTASMRYVGERKGNIDATSAGLGYVRGQPVTIPAFALFDFKARYLVTKNLEAAFIVLNVLGQDYSYPEYVRRRIDAIPGETGRRFFGQLVYRF